MLRIEDQLLIASAVDGSLPDPDATRLRDLLADSNEAWMLYRQLLSDRDRLLNLPKRPAPSRIARNVAARIDARAIVPSVPSSLVTRPRSRRLGWLPYTVAASIALMVVGGSFLVFGNKPIARHEPSKTHETDKTTGDVKPIGIPDELASHREMLPAPDAFNPNNVKDGVAKSGDSASKMAEPPKAFERNPDFLGASLGGAIPELEMATARLPLLVNLAEAGQSDYRKRILDELDRRTAVRIDLFSNDLPKSIEQVQAAMKSSGIQLGQSGKLHDQLKLKVPMAVAVVTESCSATELANLIQKLSAAEVKSPTNTRMHIYSASTADSRELKALLGTDIGLWKRPQNETGKPISDATLGQIANAIKKDSKSAVMLTSAPAAMRIPPALIPEVKQYLERRGVRSPTDVPAIFVIRTAN